MRKSRLFFAALLVLAIIAAAASEDTPPPPPPEALQESEDDTGSDDTDLEVPSSSEDQLSSMENGLAGPGTTDRRLWTWRCYRSTVSSVTRRTYKMGGRIRSIRGCLGIAIDYYYRGRWYYARRKRWACKGDSVQVLLQLKVVTWMRVRTYRSRGDRYGMNYCYAKR